MNICYPNNVFTCFAKVHHMGRATYHEADLNLLMYNISRHCYFLEMDVYLFC